MLMRLCKDFMLSSERFRLLLGKIDLRRALLQESFHVSAELLHGRNEHVSDHCECSLIR